MIGQLADPLIFSLVTDFGTANDNDDFRRHAFENRHHARGFFHIPDINTETDDRRPLRQQPFGNICRTVAQHEFGNMRRLAQRTHVGAQIAQAEGGMHIAGIDGSQGDAGHGPIIASEMPYSGRF